MARGLRRRKQRFSIIVPVVSSCFFLFPPNEIARPVATSFPMNRTPLPPRRPSETLLFEHSGFRYFGSVSFTREGKIGEVFLQTGKTGTELEAMARDLAVVASIALQHGAEPDVLRKALTRLDDGRPAGPLGAFLDLLAELT